MLDKNNEKFDLYWDDEDFDEDIENEDETADDEDAADDEGAPFEITIEDALYLAQDVDENGIPNSTASVSIEEGLDDGTTRSKSNSFITKGVFSFSISGGCAVVQIDFPRSATVEYNRVSKVLDKWFSNRDNEEYAECILMTTILPKTLRGKLVFIFEDLVYYTGIAMKDSERLILCFDNELATAAEIEGVDFDDILREAEVEAKREEELVQNEYNQLLEEIEQTEDFNPYEESIKEDYGSADIGDSDNENDESEKVENTEREKKRYGMRISK